MHAARPVRTRPQEPSGAIALRGVASDSVPADVWSSPSASRKALRVFRLAEEQPELRPASLEAAERAAAGLGERTGTVPRPVVERVIAAIADDDVRRLVGLAERLAPDRWHELVAEVGPREAREPLLVGAVTMAVAELQPPPRWLAEMRETTADLAPGPLNVLASLLHAESVWSTDEIGGAHALAAPTLRPEQRFAVVLSFARVERAAHHRERARRIAAPVARILPLASAPRTTAHLEAALATVRRSAGAAELCDLLLVAAVMKRDGLVPILPSRN